MSTVGYINISIEAFGSFLSLMIILFLLFGKKKINKLERLYIGILALNTCMQLSDAVAWIFEGTPGKTAWVLVHATNLITFVTSYILLAVFIQYLVKYISYKNKNISKIPVYTVWSVSGAAILLVLVSQFNGMLYVIDGQNMYVIQNYYWVSQVLGIAGMLTGAVVLIKYRESLYGLEATLFCLYVAMPVAAMVFQIFFPGIEMLYAANNAGILCIYIFIQAEQSRKLSENELELERSKTALMLSQIQPHFLFNTLIGIKQLCDTEPQKASKAVEHFSFFLRSNLDSIYDSPVIDFEKELTHVKDYLYLEKMRFEERLNIEWDILFTDFELPSLTLQPIVENAVLHGITAQRNGGTLRIKSEKTAEAAVITVIDNGIGFDPGIPINDGHVHIGIDNVRRRLEALCGGKLIVHSEKGVGTEVAIVLPIKEAM